MILAPLAALFAGLASASVVEVPTQQGQGSGPAIAIPGTNGDASSSLNPSAGLAAPSLQGSLGAATPTPGVTVAPGMGAVNPLQGQGPLTARPVPGADAAVAPVKTAPAKSGPAKVVPVKGGALRTTAPAGSKQGAAQATAPEGPAANSILGETARGIEQGRVNETSGVDGLTVRQALDRAYDSSTRGGDVSGGGAGANSVAGKFNSAKEKVAALVTVANTAPPANAPDLYASAIKAAQDALPASVAASVAKAVLGFAARKAEPSLAELVPAAFEAAAAGQKGETGRLLKSLEKWEGLLGAPGKPLLSNGDRVKASVTAALEAAQSGSKASAPRVWVEKRGASFVASLPGTAVEKIPAGFAAGFALKTSELALSPAAEGYRAFVASPGAGAVYRARRALGSSVPAAAVSSATYWLKALAMRAWLFLRSLLPGNSLPSVADAATTPRLREAARSWRDAAELGDAAALAAVSPRLTVSRARGAFALASRAAAAHEALTGETGAAATIEGLTKEFEAAVTKAALSPADRLTPGLEALMSGAGGLAHWASRHAGDARERGAEAFARVKGAGAVVVLEDGPAAAAAVGLASAAKGLSVTAYGSALWASGSGPNGLVRASADLRSTESGGSVTIQTASGDEKLARALDALGFAVSRSGDGLKAVLDAQTASAGAEELGALAAEAASLAMGAKKPVTHSFGGLQRLLADLKKSPADAAQVAKALDGRSWLGRARPLALVGELHAYSAEVPTRGGSVLVFALRDPETGLTQYARAERPDGAPLPPAAFAALLRAK